MRANRAKIQYVFALLALVFYAGIQVGESLHSIFVPHFVCVEHGALTHTQHHHSNHSQTSDTASLASNDDTAFHLDEHCHIFAERKNDVLVGAFGSCLTLSFDDTHDASSFVLDWSITATQPIYRLAPKTSPPLIAS
jgi:hypothetical protein